MKRRSHNAGGLFAAILVALTAACGSSEEAPPSYPTTAFDSKTIDELHAIRDDVSKIRELPPNFEVEEGWLSSEDYAAYVEESFADLDEETLEEVGAADTVLKILGILGPEDSLYDQAVDIQSNYIAGFYEFDTDQLVLVGSGGSLSPFDRSTIAHEYVHSFQGALTKEQGWDEEHDEADDADNPLEPGYIRSCIIEGDAELAETHFQGGIVEDWNAYIEYLSWMERNLYFRYSICLEFVDAIQREGGWSAVNELYETPPVSIEQVMHPEKFLMNEQPTDLAPADLSADLGEGWDRVGNGVFNEFDVWNLVMELTGDIDMATLAAGGWGMGWIAMYAEGANEEQGGVVGHIVLQFDTRRDFGEFELAFVEVLRTLGGRGEDRAWVNASGSGRAHWDRANNRVDIVVATDAVKLETAVRALGYESPAVAAVVN